MRAAAIAFLLALMSLPGAAQVSHTICELQAYDALGLSPLDGQMVDVRGVVTFPPGYVQPSFALFFIQEGECGVQVFCFEPLPFDLALGDSVHVHGELEEYISSSTGAGATTEILVWDPSDIHLLSTGHPEPVPADMSNADIQNEQNEGRLVRATGIVTDTNYDYFIWLSDGESTLQLYRSYNDHVSFSGYEPGDTLCVAGVVIQHDSGPPYFEGYELVPRFQSDFEYCEMSAVAQVSWSRIKALFR